MLPNPQQILLPGAFVSFQANLGDATTPTWYRSRPCCAIPPAATMVVGANGKVVRKNVKTDGAQNGNWLVSDGLPPVTR